MKNLSLIALFLMLLASCQQADELASPADAQRIVQRSQSTRPFQATLQSSVNPGNPLTACSGDIPGFAIPDHFLAGQATHLGNLNAALSTLHHDDCNLSFATMTLTTSVSGQLAAANADLVYYTGEDVIDVSALLTGTGTTGTIEGTWTVTGGTGRFEGASGSFTISGLVDFVTGTFSAEADGTITY
ncbi:MAG TPA: hypothetical protein VI603_17195 [Saprospiraceae bacterium]|nr:hypothetical protein [Saprospiraceae bacterium]